MVKIWRVLLAALLSLVALSAQAADQEVPYEAIDWTDGGTCGGQFWDGPGFKTPDAVWYCTQASQDPEGPNYYQYLCEFYGEDAAKISYIYISKHQASKGSTCQNRIFGSYGHVWKKPVCPANSYHHNGKCYCRSGLNSIGGQCLAADTRIKLIGPSRTKALPHGPVLPQIARVTRSGAVAAGVGVTVLLTSPGGSPTSFAGTTDAAGEFRFTYVPPYLKATVDTLKATCIECSNEDQKAIVVEPCGCE